VEIEDMKRTYLRTTATAFAGVAALLMMSASALADHEIDRHDHHDHVHPVVGGRVLDNRYHHNQYYLPRGHVIDVLPHAAVSVRFGGSPYYFHEGVWYRPFGARFTVIAPPFGLLVPFLPPFYTTLWVHGIPYYYANDVYYTWQPDERSYVVASPPNDSDVSTSNVSAQAAPPSPPGPPESSPPESSPPPPSNDQLFIYPKNGQSEQQKATDRYECHSWAAKEAAYDPTLPSSAAPTPESGDKRDDYFRAMTACLEGRGYSVK
jgi:hypothetical protein